MPLTAISKRWSAHLRRTIGWLVLCMLATAAARADLLDDVYLVNDGDGQGEALEIRFQQAIVYQRHSPRDEGSLVQVYFQLLRPDLRELSREEYRRVLGGGSIPATTVVHNGRDAAGVHSLTLTFARNSHFQISPGRDQQSLRVRFFATGQQDSQPGWRILLSRSGRAVALPTALQSLPLRQIDQGNGEQWLELGEFSDAQQAQAILYQVRAVQPTAALLARESDGEWRLVSDVPASPASEITAPATTAAPDNGEQLPVAATSPVVSAATPPLPAAADLPTTPTPSTAVPSTSSDMASAAPALNSSAQVESYAADLMQAALAAMTAGEQSKALELLNQLLNLPPNAQSEDAQELIGVTRERLGERDRAIIEYELFLRLYPTSERRNRVEQRLSQLKANAAPKIATDSSAAKADISQDVYGSVLQTWFEGSSKIDTETSNPLGNTIDRSTLSLQDQRSLLSSVDINFRRRNGSTEQRWVIRDAYLASYLDNTDDRNRLYAAYWDYRDRGLGWSARLGRQSSQVGGVLGRFDGLQTNYDGFSNQKIGIVVGQPADTGVDEKSQFTALFAEQRLLEQRLSNQVYVVRNDRSGGITTREAFGDVLSYIGQTTTWYGMVDYDSLFGELNIATLQGSWQYTSGGYLSWLMDRRKTPVIDLGNALIGEPVQSLAELIDLLGEDTVMQYARDRTADADGASLNLTYPLASNWQIGMDVRSYKIGELPASGSLPASPGTGNVVTVGAQVIGNGLFASRDAHVWSVSQIQGERYDGWSLAYTLLWPATDSLTVEPSLRYYDQKDESGATLARWTPTLRLRYQFSQHMVLELQYDGEQSLSETDSTSDQLSRQLWSVGYVWEF
ncbi:hypothetical protein HPT27_09510 [Permianibacter sp. IMCC34836]|uniref:hypothetical protein n=1 Tax=Permianibacter fluminis TaxID=2738515 RepID=UPI0015576F72|nr:hypothetical protein [Permianibacter fluminis]NQD37263.1 hypothetical protein [Permianibacter fluminis]